jgi:curli production assembly/transport component CsgF
MEKKIAFVMILNLFISYRAYATDQQFQFKNPSFSGDGYSSHVLTIENEEYTRKKANEQAADQAAQAAALAANSTTLQKFLNYLESRIYAQLATQLTNDMFGENASNSGTVTIEGNTITYVKDTQNVTLTVTDDTGNITTVTIPVGAFTF